MRISEGPLHILLLLLLALEPTWTATILHHGGGAISAVSHQSFVRLSTQPAQQIILPRIINKEQQLQLPLSPDVKDLPHTPAHLAYAAHPVVHQTLSRIKPVRNLSYASFIPGPRSRD